MPDTYHQLLDATICHLESLRQRGVRYVDVSPESLSRLSKPAKQKNTAVPLGQAEQQRPDEPSVCDSPQLSADEREATMAKLCDEALACTKCDHLVSTRTQVVFGVGTVQAELMFIGEAPGQDEDRQDLRRGLLRAQVHVASAEEGLAGVARECRGGALSPRATPHSLSFKLVGP